MSDIKTQKCDGDGCNKLRMNDANHWLMGWPVLGEGLRGVSMVFMTDEARENVEHQLPESLQGKVKHFCGEQCAQRWFILELQRMRETPK